MSKGIFITAVDTEMGKTYITSLIIRELQKKAINVGYFKAALSGDENGENDASYIKKTCKLQEETDFFVPYIYKTAVSPHLAGKIEKNPVEMAVVKKAFNQVAAKYPFIVAEGSGGILCPLGWDDEKIFLEDIINLTNFPLVIVANSQVGAINSTVLTVEYAKNHKLKIAGIILNNFTKGNIVHEDNKNLIEKLSKIPVIATVASGDTTINIDKLCQILKLNI
ncbi:MAG: dethiobiotin synthase [Clostridiales bacterium]